MATKTHTGTNSAETINKSTSLDDWIIYALGGNDIVTGGAGKDFIIGGAGTDTLNGGAGNDTLQGGAGNDTIDGGAGTDLIDFSDAIGGVGINFTLTQSSSLTTFIAPTTTGLGTDKYKNIEGVVGTNFADTLTGSIKDDTIYGGAGNDIISGGGGNDTIVGGAGADRLTGGNGNDVFVYLDASDSPASDVITDFSQGSDKIDLSALRGSLNLIWGGTIANVQNGLWYDKTGSSTFLYADTNGIAGAELKIELQNTSALTPKITDFIGVENAAPATVTTDLPDYAAGSTATIQASGLTAGSTAKFHVLHVDDAGKDRTYGTADDVLGDNSGAGHEAWYVTDGGAGDLDGVADGNVTTSWYVNPDDSFGATFVLTATGIASTGTDGTAGTVDDVLTGQVATTSFTDSRPVDNPGKIDQLFQWANVRADWETGNLSNKAIMQEGDVVPYFVEFSDLLVSGATTYYYTVVIEWDTTHLGLHAFDYITSYNFTDFEGFDPLLANPTNPAFEIGLGTGAQDDPLPDDTVGIPNDPFMNGLTAAGDQGFDGNQAEGDFSIWNGFFNVAVLPDTRYDTPDDYDHNTSTSIAVTFAATSPDVVLAWGGHIAVDGEWEGEENAAFNIDGSPYHMRIESAFLDMDGDGVLDPDDGDVEINGTGQRDRSIKTSEIDRGGPPAGQPGPLVQLDDDDVSGAGGNPAGPGDDVAPLFASGPLVVDYGPDGPGFVVLTSNWILPSLDFDAELSLDALTVTISQVSTGLDVLLVTLTPVTLDPSDPAFGTYNYAVTQPNAIDHLLTDDPLTPEIETAFEDNLSFFVEFQVTDGDIVTPESSVGTFLINVDDDSPVAVDDDDSVTEDGPTIATGNVITAADGGLGSDLNFTDGVVDSAGADGLGSISWIGEVGGTVDGTFGTLTVDSAGNYSYELDNASVQSLDGGETESDVFTYTITDGDGDSDQATLAITINGTDDVTFAVSVDDDGGESAGTAVSVNEEDGSDNEATFTVAMSGTLSLGNTASVELSFPGTATDAVDYTAAIETAIADAIAALDISNPGHGISYNSGTDTLGFTGGGLTSLSLTLTAVNDIDLDSGETIQVALSGAAINEGNASVTTALATATITDEDQAITITIADTKATISEEAGETDTFTISLSEAMNAGNVVTVDVDFATGTDTENADFVTAAQAALQAVADATAGVSFDGTTLTYTDAFVGTDLAFSVTAADDDELDSPETLNITLSNATALNGSATAADAEDVTITDIDVAVTFAITVTSENPLDDTPTQLAGIAEESTTDNEGTFTITKGGDALVGANTASVTLTMSGTATDADFTSAVIAAVASAATTAGIGVSAQDGDSLVLTWAAGDPASFDVDLTAFDDNSIEAIEALTLALSVPTVDGGSATLVGGQTAATLTVDEFEPRVLNGTMITNSNVTNQFVLMTFQEDGRAPSSGNPLHAAAKIYDLNLQGQQGSVIQDVGFNIDPAKHYEVTVEAISGTKAIITDLTLEGVVIQGSGNAQLELDNTTSTSSDSTAITAIIDPLTSPIVQAKTESTDGNQNVNTLTDAGAGPFNYLFGADGNDTLNGSADPDVLNGGGGTDTLNGMDGNDILVYDNTNDDTINGGTGFDLLRIDTGALALSQAGSASNSNTLDADDNPLVILTGKAISNIEGILISEEAGQSTTGFDPNDDVGTTVKLNLADVIAYTDSDDDLWVLGSPGDKLQLVDADWSNGVLQPMDSQGQAFVQYTATADATVQLFVETDVTVDLII